VKRETGKVKSANKDPSSAIKRRTGKKRRTGSGQARNSQWSMVNREKRNGKSETNES